jgi:hypothetical protein
LVISSTVEKQLEASVGRTNLLEKVFCRAEKFGDDDLIAVLP